VSWEDSYHGQLRATVGDDRVVIFVGARCVVRDADGRVLLIRRSDNGMWGMPAGGMELGNTLAETAARELWEETGLTATSLVPFAVYSGPDAQINMYGHAYQYIAMAFLVESWTGELLTETDETTDARFYALGALPADTGLSVTTTLADLATWEATGMFVAK
jgi:ADP-ribose pyrophosphatase YjhB (NUDIX family)